MAKPKDFSAVNTGRVYDTIAEATAEPAQETQGTRKERRTYTEQETEEFLQNMKTAGRKGLKLPRVNFAFAPDIYDFVKTMSRVSGLNMTDYINSILRQYMEEHRDIYEKAIEFRNSL